MTYQSHIDPLPLPASIDSCCLFALIHSQNNISFTLLPQTQSVTAILFPLLCCYTKELDWYVFPSISIASNFDTISLPSPCTIYRRISELSVLQSVWTPAACTVVFAGHKNCTSSWSLITQENAVDLHSMGTVPEDSRRRLLKTNTGPHLLCFPFVTNLKSKVCTGLTTQNITENDSIISHARNTIALQSQRMFNRNTWVSGH